MNEQKTLSLPECRERLAKEMGSAAPSLVTLKRWSSGGRFGAGKVVVEGKARFDYQAVRAAALEGVERSTSAGARTSRMRMAAKAGAEAAAKDAGLTEGKVAVFDEEDRKEIEGRLVDALREHSETIGEKVRKEVRESLTGEWVKELVREVVRAEVEKLGGELVRAVESVESIRRTLMLKYDGETASLRAKLADIQERDAAAEDVRQSLLRLMARTSNILDVVNRIELNGSGDGQ